MYRPFQNESLELKETKENNDVCENLLLHPVNITAIEENKENLRNSHVIKVRQKVMPFIQDVEEAREAVAVLNTELVGEELDAENAQNNEECNIMGDEVHPEFEVQHPDFFYEGNLPPQKSYCVLPKN